MSKVVIIDNQDTKIISAALGPTGAEHRHRSNEVLELALTQAKLSFDQVSFVVATGYGRMNVPFADQQVTEISCHAQGVYSLFPSARTIIDIGGQDCKGIKLEGDGKLANFVMNDKCAAGTGRFLEVTSEALGVKLEAIGPMSLQSSDKVQISNICAVFAAQEVAGYLSRGIPVENILAGLHDAIATRIVHMVAWLQIEKDIVLTGGGAKNAGLVKALEKRLGYSVLVAPEPLLTGALGAAILGKKSFKKGIHRRGNRRLGRVGFA
jgi:predicted CoA-substrate-specific enzyme activase